MTVANPLANPLADPWTDRFLDRRHLWRVLRASHIYRLALAALLLAAFGLDEQSRLFGKQHPNLFLGVALGYMALTLLAIAGSYWRRPRLPVQAHLQMLVDLVALTVLIHASGGLMSSLNSLLITAVAASSILLPLSSALLAAALGFFLLIGSWLASQWQAAEAMARTGRGSGGWSGLWERLGQVSDDWVRLGVLGAALFIAAALTYALAERARRGEGLARRRTLELLEVAELNQGIIRHLQNGVVVVDGGGRVLLLNDTARDALGWTDTGSGMMLEALSPPLAERLRAWLDGAGLEARAFRPAEHRPELTPRFTRLSGLRAANILILLEDSEQAAERLQQIKLAALGRLTAGIAHEIRNPLAAISHAAQLLQESTSASASDRRLAQIIHDHVKRANRIIADVLDLARRDRVKPERLTLAPWLEEFGQEFAPDGDGPPPEWRQTVEPASLTVRFDPHQLRQVLWNLCANACQHGVRPGEPPRIELRARLKSGRGRPFLEVRDAGPGISEDNVIKLFEPFFTTRARGTGLGLYLARELCEANRAQLQYLPITEGGCCFRITFAPIGPAQETE
jgi:two-component system sensor histidine kinase PilS (NtrC family)